MPPNAKHTEPTFNHWSILNHTKSNTVLQQTYKKQQQKASQVEMEATNSTDLKSFLQDFLCFGSTDSAMDSNLFISADTEGSYSVTGWGGRKKH